MYLFAIALGFAAASPGVARAQTDHDRAAARSAADAGADAFEQGHFERSLEFFGRAEQLVHAPPHLLYMARSLAKLGRLVDAREAYFKLINEQLPATSPKAFKSAQEQAENEIGDIETRIAYITVTIRGRDATKAALSIDHTNVPAAEQGIPLPMDPGTHVFSAHTDQARSNEITVTLRDGTKESVELTLSEPAVEAVAAPVPPSSTQQEPTDRGGSGTVRRVVAYSALGVGAVAAGVGTYFLVSFLDSHHKANEIYGCDATSSCTDDEITAVGRHDHDAKIAGDWAIAAYAVSAVGIATGVVLLVTDHGSPSAGTAHGPELRLSARLGSVALSGRF
jgi:hypothetical protein